MTRFTPQHFTDLSTCQTIFFRSFCLGSLTSYRIWREMEFWYVYRMALKSLKSQFPTVKVKPRSRKSRSKNLIRFPQNMWVVHRRKNQCFELKGTSPSTLAQNCYSILAYRGLGSKLIWMSVNWETKKEINQNVMERYDFFFNGVGER